MQWLDAETRHERSAAKNTRVIRLSDGLFLLVGSTSFEKTACVLNARITLDLTNASELPCNSDHCCKDRGLAVECILLFIYFDARLGRAVSFGQSSTH
jgi:hypothetical protein